MRIREFCVNSETHFKISELLNKCCICVDLRQVLRMTLRFAVRYVAAKYRA